MIRLPIRTADEIPTGTTRVQGGRVGDRPAHHALAWAGLGFLAGVLFWHAVGFWQFLSDAVLQEGRAEITRSGQATPMVSTQHIKAPKTTPAHAAGAPCVVLELDRMSGTTSAVSCNGRQWHHRHTGLTPRRDREAMSRELASGGGDTAAAWSVTVAVPTPRIATSE